MSRNPADVANDCAIYIEDPNRTGHSRGQNVQKDLRDSQKLCSSSGVNIMKTGNSKCEANSRTGFPRQVPRCRRVKN